MQTRQLIYLTETGKVLMLLVQFAHNHPHPDITSLDKRELFGLAEAAEKYLVYSAMSVCCATILFRKKKFPAQALNYAVKFNHPHVADAAAPLTIDRSGEGMHGELGGSPGAFLAWLRYKVDVIERIEDVRAATVIAVGQGIGVRKSCPSCLGFGKCANLKDDWGTMQTCRKCSGTGKIVSFQDLLHEKMRSVVENASIPKFTSFLN